MTGLVMQPHMGIVSKTAFMEEKVTGGILKIQQLVIFHLHWIFRRAVFSGFLAPCNSSKGSKQDAVLAPAAMGTTTAASKEEKLKLY